MNSLKTSRRLVALFVIAAVAVGIAGSAGPGHAAPGITFTFEPLIGTSSINEIPKVTYGRGIGFHLFAQNNGTNSTPQTSSVIVTSDSATYDSTAPAAATFNGTPITTCAASQTDSKQLICPLPYGTLRPGDTFEAFFRFIAPTSTDVKQVSTTATLSVAAQTVGGKKNNGTTLSKTTLLTNLVSDTDIDNAYLRHDETASPLGASSTPTSSHPQNFALTTPSTLLNNAFGVAVGIQDTKGTAANPCPGLLPACTILTVPAAKLAESPPPALPGTPFPGNPFYDGTANPYIWNMDATYTGGFTLTGVVHVDDLGNVQPLHQCSAVGGPSAAEPLCYDHLTQDKPNKLLHADGRGIENGSLGWT